MANELYEYFISKIQSHVKKTVKAGSFGAMMDVSLLNNGPVTIIIDSKNKD